MYSPTLTTGSIAGICKVAPRTVSKWFDSGILQGYRIPGSQDRRVTTESFIKFARQYGLPESAIDDCSLPLVLFLSRNEELIGSITKCLNEKVRLLAAGTTFEAGMVIARRKPDVVVMDDTFVSCRRLAEKLVFGIGSWKPRVIGITDQREFPSLFGQVSETFHVPFDVTLLARRIEKIMRI